MILLNILLVSFFNYSSLIVIIYLYFPGLSIIFLNQSPTVLLRVTASGESAVILNAYFFISLSLIKLSIVWITYWPIPPTKGMKATTVLNKLPVKVLFSNFT